MNAPADAPDLDAMVEGVHDERTFIAFVEALSDDFALEQKLEAANPAAPYSMGHLGWANGTVNAFLDRAAAWGGMNMRGNPAALGTNPWHRCAWILYAGKFYE
jgi:hypothetical protein